MGDELPQRGIAAIVFARRINQWAHLAPHGGAGQLAARVLRRHRALGRHAPLASRALTLGQSDRYARFIERAPDSQELVLAHAAPAVWPTSASAWEAGVVGDEASPHETSEQRPSVAHPSHDLIKARREPHETSEQHLSVAPSLAEVRRALQRNAAETAMPTPASPPLREERIRAPGARRAAAVTERSAREPLATTHAVSHPEGVAVARPQVEVTDIARAASFEPPDAASNNAPPVAQATSSPRDAKSGQMPTTQREGQRSASAMPADNVLATRATPEAYSEGHPEPRGRSDVVRPARETPAPAPSQVVSQTDGPPSAALRSESASLSRTTSLEAPGSTDVARRAEATVMSAIEPPLGQEQGETDRAEIEGLPAAVAGDAPKAPASAPSSTTGEPAPARRTVDRMEMTRSLDPPHLGASQTPQYLARTLDANTTRKGEPPLEATPEVGEALPGLQEREIDAIGIESAATLVARGPIIPPSRPREVSLGDSAVDATRPQGGGRELPDTPQPAALRPLRSAMPEQEASGSLPGAVQHGVDQERSLPTQPSPLQDAVPTRARRIAADAPSIRHQPPSVSAWSMPLESVADETGALPGAPLGQDASAPPELPEPSRLRDIPLHEALFGPEAGEGRGLVRRAERPKPQDERADVASESLPALEVTVVRRQAETSQEPTTPAPEQGSGAASPDIEQLAEEVYRRIRERLRIERERRGESGPRWR